MSGVGVSLWLPVLDVMCNDSGTAFAQGAALPTTFGIFYWGNGVHTEDWTPSGTGDGDAWALTRNISSFKDLKGDMTLVTGLQMMDGVFKGHGWGVVYVLAGGDGTACTTIADISKSPYGALPETAQGTQWQPTLDQVIASAIYKNEPYKSLETGILKYTGLNMGTASLNLAHTGPNKPLPPERDPSALFNKLFKTGAPVTGTTGMPTDVSGKLRKSVLDAVLADANRLKMSVGSADAQRLDAHMESIRSLEARINTMSGGTGSGGSGGGGGNSNCVSPTAPTEKAANLDLTKVTNTSHAMNQLIAAALSCNMTRVYSHLWSGARDDNHYPTAPVNIDTEHHTLTHNNDDASQAKASVMEQYIMSQYADLAQTLKNTKMGSTTLLDQTIIYGISEQGEKPHDHNMRNYHIVLMGHAGGKVKGNRHVRLVGRKVTELMLTLQQLMGMNVTSYGSWDKTSKTMPEIM
ncbi:MAG TPA: DUF1552 domain-containing protein [Polyangia bacterium]